MPYLSSQAARQIKLVTVHSPDKGSSTICPIIPHGQYIQQAGDWLSSASLPVKAGIISEMKQRAETASSAQLFVGSLHSRILSHLLQPL